MRVALLLDAAAEGIGAARSHPLRAALAGVAIAAAVATLATVVVTLDAIENFARVNAARAFGSDTFVMAKIASVGQLSRRELALKQERNPNIERSDLRFMERYADNRVVYGATVNRAVEVAAGSEKYPGASLIGATATLAGLRDLAFESGRFFTREEADRAAFVAVIGATIVDTLYPNVDPLGRTIRIAGRGFRVIGVQERQGNISGVSLDRNVWIPLRASERLFGAPATLQLLAKPPEATSTAQVRRAEDHARISMRARRQLQPGDADNFDILSPEAARSFVQSLSERVGVAAAPISAMALLAAVIVVTNTILVSVTQRTNEIGIRRAVGASRAQIMAEVLAESLFIGVFGGAVGLGMVYVLVPVARAAGLEVELQASTALTSLVAASLSGIVAGWYPARRATRIDVVDALRSE
ncbi:MAG: FtsX-like permease family protein [Acidobacteria bacterium]|nr:FtsX-like permease family protein [Acidobacteriota bacterium]